MRLKWTSINFKKKKLHNWVLYGRRTRLFLKCTSIGIPRVNLTHAEYNSLMDKWCLQIRFIWLWGTRLDIFMKILIKGPSRILTYQLQEYPLTLFCRKLPPWRISSTIKAIYNFRLPAIIGPLWEVMINMFC